MAAKIRFNSWIVRIIHSDYFAVGLLLIINLIIGILIFPTYGESWDEQLRYQYAERSLAAYHGSGSGLIDEKGAFYVMIAKLGSDLIRKIQPSLYPIQAWHLIHFLSFLMGVFFLYKICLKLVGKWAAFGTALLFNTSPLLWGHAFINPKDIPFMAFFLGSVALGMDMADYFAENRLIDQTNNEQDWRSELRLSIKQDYKTGSRLKQFLFLIINASAVILLFLFIFLKSQFLEVISTVIDQANRRESIQLLNQFFSTLAQNRQTVPIELYVQKAGILFDRLILVYAGLVIIFLILSAALVLPGTANKVWQRAIKPFTVNTLRSLIKPSVITAGILLGLTTSIRVLGPAAGLLVALFFFLKSKWKSLPPLLAYAIIAVVVTYLSWPYLWGAPVRNFLHSLTIASDYPWEGNVRFGGVDYLVTAVPRSYLPVLILLQTPVFVLALFFVGLGVAIWGALTKKLDLSKILLAGLWFFVPFLAVIIIQPTMYDNFRQFLFILPGAYLFVAFGLQFLLRFINRTSFQVLLIAVLVIPNIYWLIQLHPYQYIYYNIFTGYTAGAFRKFETDYWATSYQEATAWLDTNSPENSGVLVVGPNHIVEHYRRADLRISGYSARDPVQLLPPFYAVIYTRFDKDQSLFPDAEEVFQVIRDGAILAVVKYIP